MRQIAAGVSHMGIVTDTCDMFVCGCGVNGRLGLGDEGAGADANCNVLAAESGLLAMIVGICRGRLGSCGAWRGYVGEGVVRLLGGGLD